MENKHCLNNWLPSFAGRQGRKINNKYLNLALDQYYFCLEKIPFIINCEKQIIFEIGFGSGEVLIDQALKNENSLLIGCEVYAKGIAKLAYTINNLMINNIRIFRGDGRDLLLHFPEKSIDTILLLFPDPWPKKKHNKRRIVNQKFIDLCISKLKLTGRIIIATDHDDYFRWIKNHIDKNQSCVYKLEDDLTHILPTVTKYQKKSEKRIQCFILEHKKIFCNNALQYNIYSVCKK